MFRIYFQYGEFQDAGFDLLKDFILPLVGIGIPLLIYYLGIKHDRNKQENQKNLVELNKLKYLAFLLDGAIYFGSSFRQLLELFISKLTLDLTFIESITITSDDDLRRLVFEIHRDEYYHAFVNKIGDDGIKYIFRNLDVLNGHREYFYKNWEKELSINTQNRSFITEKISLLYAETRRIPDLNDLDHEMITSIYKLNSKWEEESLLKTPGEQLKLMNDIIFTPIPEMILGCDPLDKIKWFPVQDNALQISNKIDTVYLQGNAFLLQCKSILAEVIEVNEELVKNRKKLDFQF